jgi:hypothetical protein
VDGARLGKKLLMLVIERHIVGTKVEFHCASLAGLEMNSPEALQFPHRPAYSGRILVNVKLHDLVPFTRARIAYLG